MAISDGQGKDSFLENGSPLQRGGDVGFLPDTPFREKIDLSGVWDYSVEEGGEGRVTLPAAGDFVGTTTFSRTFDVSPDRIDRYSFELVMLGVNYECEIYLNGDFLGSHRGGYTSFVKQVPDNMLQPGAGNLLKIVAKNELDDRNTVPLRLQVWGWRNYGGVIRDLFLLAVPRLSIADMVVQSSLTRDLSAALVSVETKFEGSYDLTPADPKRNVSLAFYFDLVDKITGASVGESRPVPLEQTSDGWSCPVSELTLKNPKIWSPEHPELYVAKGFLVRNEGKEATPIDQFDLNCGFRILEIVDGDFRLNAGKLVLKGVVWNEDHPSWGSSLPPEQMEKDVVLMKSLGANAIRFGSHPPHPYMLNLCDRYGLLAMVELPVAYTPSSVLEDEYYTQQAETMLREMITRDRSHVSVLAWGIGEGFESSATGTKTFVKTLVSAARSLDSRPVYYASVMHASDVCTELVDIAGLNLYTRDPALFRQKLDQWKAMNPGKPLVVMKFGVEVQQGNRNGYSDPLSYEFQARYFLQRQEDIRQAGYDGSFVWAFNDWRVDRPSLTIASGDPRVQTMGLVSVRREKRLAFDAVQSLFRGEKFVALPAGNFSSAAPMVFVLSGLVLLIGTAYLYNADRRFRESINRSTMNSFNFFSDIRDQRLVSMFHSVVVGLVTSSALAVVTSTALYNFRGSWVLDGALSYLISSDAIKEFVISLIRDPLSLVLYSTALFFLLLLLVSLFIFVTATFLKSRVFPYHAFTLVMWSTVPLLLLIPVGMILFRLLESGEYVGPSMLLVFLLMSWVFMRIHKGTAIIADAVRPKVYLVGITSLVTLAAAGYFLLDYSQSASEYLAFLYNVASTSY